MAHSPSNRETEIKLSLDSTQDGLRRLKRAGFRISKDRVFEANIVFDNAAGTLRTAGTLLRVREVNGSGLLTYKGPGQPGRHKTREEIETRFEQPAAMMTILDRLGFRPAFRYEKFRAEYTDGAGIATLDETPIGCFLELEGEPKWIDRSAAALGFAESDYITASYLRLYLDDCARRQAVPGDMVFPAAR